ncbi:hypothetical protein OG592_36720 [Streptomyces avidinii]|uniref:hypothetical protein n=1 Tax=Streptomyces avidinii TaxID=1895 RepID=UPI00386EC173|nr:hypothetical protein OG592_36720 [Streptomyces avidinii]
MRKIKAQLFISLDGVVEAPDQWHFPYFNEEMGAAAGLLDELNLLLHPIAVRSGQRLFDEGAPPIPLELVSAETFRTGVLNLFYAVAAAPGEGTYEEAKTHLPQH